MVRKIGCAVKEQAGLTHISFLIEQLLAGRKQRQIPTSSAEHSGEGHSHLHTTKARDQPMRRPAFLASARLSH
jgi:hypothetical protein